MHRDTYNLKNWTGLRSVKFFLTVQSASKSFRGEAVKEYYNHKLWSATKDHRGGREAFSALSCWQIEICTYQIKSSGHSYWIILLVLAKSLKAT